MKLTRPFALSLSKGIAALAVVIACSAALSAELPLADAAALQSIGAANRQTAVALELATCAGERSAVAQAATGCTDTVCRVSIAAIAALTPCAAARAQGIVQAQAAPPQIINAAPPPTVGERIVGLFAGGVGKLFDTAIALGPSYLNYRLGTVQSANQTALAMRQSDNALAATASTNGTFAALGNNIAGTATAGFAANTNIAATGFAAVKETTNSGFGTALVLASRPTNVTTITGNGNATNGSTVSTTTTTTTNTNNCPGGDGGNGTGAASGNAGADPSGGTSGTGGTGTAGAGGLVNCTAGR